MTINLSSRAWAWAVAMILGVTALGTVGCQTYVNIPHQTGDVASADPNGSNVGRVTSEALRGLAVQLLDEGLYEVVLPAGTNSEAYDAIVTAAGSSYTWSNRDDAEQSVDKLEVRTVRIRGLNASVDIIRSSQPGDPDAPQQLVTVYLKNYVIGGWAARQVRVWRLSVANAIQQSELDPMGSGSQP